MYNDEDIKHIYDYSFNVNIRSEVIFKDNMVYYAEFRYNYNCPKQYLLKNFTPTSDSNVSLQTTNSSKQEEIPNQPIVQNNDQELLNSINNELKYLKGNFDRFMKPNFEKFYKGDVGSKKELLSSIVSTFMYVNKLNDLLVKSGKSKNVPYESTDNSLNVSMEKLLNRFLFIEKNFELFFGNELTINNLNNFLPRIAALLKIFYHSVNNFD